VKLWPLPALYKGILILLLALLLFDIMGVMIKILGERYPVFQVAMYRNLFAFIPAIIALYTSVSWHKQGRPLGLKRWKLGLVRGLFIVFAQGCFYLALQHMEFATATSIAFAGPLITTALSVVLLKMTVGVWRWFAVLISFSGILMVMQPGSEIFTWYAILPLLASAGYATNSITSRLFDDTVPTPVINLYASVSSLIGTSLIVLTTDSYVPVASATDWLLLVAMGLSGGAAVFLWITAFRMTEPGNLTPFEYFGIPTAFVLGWMFFGEAPFDRLLPGVLLIIVGGFMIIWRERVNEKAA
jgi:drug/metabolite transporter (DMT)-like permease